MPRGASRPVRRRKTVSHYSDDNPSTFTVKRRKGEPPVPDPSPTESSSTSCPLSRKRKAPSDHHKRRLPEPEYDTILAHRSRIQTILPVQEFLSSSSNSRSSTNLASLPPTFGIPLPPSPSWTEPNTHDCDESITWLSIRQDDPSYAVAGTVHGTLLLLSQNTTTTILQTIHTTSAAQRVTGRKNCNAIVQAVWSHHHVVVLTRSELEWIALHNNNNDNDDTAPPSIVLTHPISAQQQQQRTSQSPVLSLQGQELLWCDGQQRLWRGATPQGVLTPISTSLRCWTVLWETSGSDDSSRTFLLVASGESVVELLRGRYTRPSNDNNNDAGQLQILLRRTVPSGRNAVDCTIQQFADNNNNNNSNNNSNYTFVCGRGIRMYETHDLTLLRTFGESVQLHGQTTLWSRCCWLRRPDFARKQVKSTKRMFWLEKEDVLAPTTHNEDNKDDEREFWLMGIPHPRKGPLELQSTFYFLSPNHATTTTRDGPPKGCLGDVWVDRDRWSITAVSAEKGRLMELSPNMKTDFPGVMYPVGFNEIDNNIEYIEDEDELDEPYTDDPRKDLLDDDTTDPELVEAMRQSLLEAQAKQPQPEDDRVHVMASSSPTTTQVAAWPEISRSDSSDSGGGGGGSPLRRAATDSILPLHIQHVRFALDTQQQQQEQNEQQQQQQQPQAKPATKKRLAHIEALLQSSVTPELRGRMEHLRGSWVDSRGSALDPVQLRHSFEEKTLALELLLLSPAAAAASATVPPPTTNDEDDDEDKRCPACMGRLVFHSCGKRDMPVDHDAIERADREREQREQAEKQRIKIRKRKEAEARRKEAKRLRRVEEERQRELEEQRRQEQIKAAPVVVTTTPQSPYHGSMFNINGNQVHSSTSLHPTDALAALAGLADSFAQPMQYTTTTTTQQNTDSSSPLDLLSSASAQVSQNRSSRTTVVAQPTQGVVPEAPLVRWSSTSTSVSKVVPAVASDRREQEETRLTPSVQMPATLDLLSSASDQAPKAPSVSFVNLGAPRYPTANSQEPSPVYKNPQHGSGSQDFQDRPFVYQNRQEHGFGSTENPSFTKSRVLAEEVANGLLQGGEAQKNGTRSSDTATDAVSALVMLCGAADPVRGSSDQLSPQPHETPKAQQVNGEHGLSPLRQSAAQPQEVSKENASAVESKSSSSVSEMSTHHHTNGYDVTTAVEKTSFPSSTVPTPELSKDDEEEDSSVDRFVDKAAMKGTGTVSATKVEG